LSSSQLQSQPSTPTHATIEQAEEILSQIEAQKRTKNKEQEQRLPDPPVIARSPSFFSIDNEPFIMSLGSP
jgi:predicted KAP-like P-loop ATPase